MRSWMIGFVLGCTAASQLPVVSGVVLATGAFTLASLVLFALLCRRGSAAALLAGVFGGAVCVGLYANAFIQSRVPQQCVGETAIVSGVVASLVDVSLVHGDTRRQRFLFTLDTMQPLECAGPRNIQLSYYGDAQLESGQRWMFSVKLKRPWANANPGSGNRQAWYAAQGIDALGSVRDARSARFLGDDDSLWFAHQRARRDVSDRIATLQIS